MRTWGEHSYVDRWSGVVYAPAHCCHAHQHGGGDREDGTPELETDHAESIAVWCCQLTAVRHEKTNCVGSDTTTPPLLRVEASLLDRGPHGADESFAGPWADPTEQKRARVTEEEWTRVSIVRNATCTCGVVRCAPRTDFRAYTRTGTFADGRVYMTDGRRYVAQLRPEPDSPWHHFDDASFATALGFPRPATAAAAATSAADEIPGRRRVLHP